MLVDSHCHLDFPDFAGQVPEILSRARENGVGACVSIGTQLSQFDGVLAVARQYDNVWCSVGIHPHEAEKERLTDAAPLLERARDAKVVGLGETGLDYFYEHSPR
jgi:TatD DNase family protein